MSTPLVSICIPSFNYGGYIAVAVDSALSQEHQNIEVIVSDNGSTDTTLEVLAGYAEDPRVRVFRNERNLGIAGNINACIHRATGEYIVILSADDFLYPSHVRSCLARMFDPSDPVDIVYGGGLFVDHSGTAYSSRATIGLLPMAYSRRNEFAASSISCYICMPTMLVPKRIYTELGGVDPEFAIACDWELTLRFAAAGKRFAQIAEPITAVRLHDNQASNYANYSSTGKGYGEYLGILERHLTDANAWRFAGYERRIQRMFRAWHAHAATTDFYAENASFAARSSTLLDKLDGWALGRTADRPPEVPRVSIIMPTGGNVSVLHHAMQSLCDQTFTSWEVIVVQSSGQNCEGWLRSFSTAAKIRHIRPDSHMNPAAARNMAIQLACGEFITYLDDDNSIAPDHLERLVATMDATGTDVAVAGTYLVIDEYLSEMSGHRKPLARLSDIYRESTDSRSSYLANSLPLNAVMHTIAVLDRISGFREDFAILEDWEFMLRLEQSHRLVFTGVPTLEVHNTLAFAEQHFLRYGPPAYLHLLDVMYAANPAPTAELAGLRTLYRKELESLFVDFSARSCSLEGMIDFLYRLAGRHAQFTQPLADAEAVLIGARA